MATAKLHDGQAIVAYNAKGEAIDSDGAVIKGAPRPPKDTPPDQQPGALGAATPEERIAVAVARAMKDPDKVLANAGAANPASDEDEGTDSDEEEGLPPLAEMQDHLAGIKTVEEVESLRKQDKRKGAKPLYKARLAELDT